MSDIYFDISIFKYMYINLTYTSDIKKSLGMMVVPITSNRVCLFNFTLSGVKMCTIDLVPQAYSVYLILNCTYENNGAYLYILSNAPGVYYEYQNYTNCQ